MNEGMNVQQAIACIEQPRSTALDAVGRKAAIDDLLNKVALVMEVQERIMKQGEHYGTVPGCGDKPALFKAGAEKLGMTFRLKPTFNVSERDMGNGHREYRVDCLLSDGTMGVGTCSTMESKYRYRQGERKCPECGKATIITGKKEYGGGFLCFAKKGGCGAKFADDDQRITGQFVGKVEHDNPADFYNTCLKMGKKRAHVDAIITATACSDIFTQDVEEMVAQADATAAPAATQPPATKQDAPKQPPAKDTKKAAPKPDVVPTVYPCVTVEMVTEKKGTTNGKAWTAYMILLNDGFANIECGTFSKTLFGVARTLSESKQNGEATVKPGIKEGTFELVSLLPVEAPGGAADQVPMEFNAEGEPIETTP